MGRSSLYPKGKRSLADLGCQIQRHALRTRLIQGVTVGVGV